MSEHFLSQEQQESFNRDGFLLIESFIDKAFAAAVADRYKSIFWGEFETTVPPDEWRWAPGRDPEHVTRMIWNGWKSDRLIARMVLQEKIGFYCAKLMGWSGTRLNQDGCLWKPPFCKTGLAFHRDNHYVKWIVPHEMVTCWVALDEVNSNSGTLEYARGSHLWPLGDKPDDFHAPEDHRRQVKKAAEEIGVDLDIVSVTLPRGGVAFHHPWTWHGSGPNQTSEDRRSLAVHCMSEKSQFHPTNPAYAQGRFRKFGSPDMEESFYPIIWSESGCRSEFIPQYLESSGLEYQSHFFKSYH